MAMRLLAVSDDGHFIQERFAKDSIPPYAILSHRWSTHEDDEITFKEIVEGTHDKKKSGYQKLQFCSAQAKADGLHYFWVDTCCINQSDQNELSIAIYSMFRWYQKAVKCYVYLADVSITKRRASDSFSENAWEPAFRSSEWFARGWTLQELLAPEIVEFYSRDGVRLGNKSSLEQQIAEITEIPIEALRGKPLSRFTAQEIFGWVERRHTKNAEDKAYCLLGVFDVSMLLDYGEGEKIAFSRLYREIENHVPDMDGLLKNLPYAADAPFNTAKWQHEPTCLPDTRVDLQQQIQDWIDGGDERTIFWLYGLAGTGKSTIARTIAHNCFQQGRLGASFFFSKGGGDISNAGKFFTTIAIQLSEESPYLKRCIYNAVKKNKSIATQSYANQWRQLILGPLSKLDRGYRSFSFVFVIDAIDECESDADIRLILQLLVEAQSLKKIRFRVFLTSRPEIPIRHGMYGIPQAKHQDVVLQDIPPATINHDISIFLEYNLGIIRQEWTLGADWPGEMVLRQLVLQSCGLFIWATTACRFIREGKRFAPKRLDTILKGSSSGVTIPEKHLDEIYLAVLKHSISSDYSDEEQEEVCNMLKHTLGSLVVLLSSLSTSSLSRLLHLPREDVDATFDDLYAILDIPKDPTHQLRLHHPSFRDFLLNKGRCGEFWVDEKEAHQNLAAKCIQLMSQTLKKDICEMHAPSSQTSQVENSWIKKCLPSEVQYACLYWVQHLQRGGSHARDSEEAHQFLQAHLLHWLEALGWMGKTSQGILAIDALDALILAKRSPNLHAFIHDAKRFVLDHRLAIEQNPLQIYQLAFVSTLETGIVGKHLEKRDGGDESEAESDISDVPSIFSTTDSLAPSNSSYASTQAYYINAAEHLTAELLKENELKSLYKAALAKFGEARFAKNHDVLLKELLIALRLGATGNQLQAIRMLRGKNSRSRVTSRIMGLLELTNLAREQSMQDFEQLELDRQYSLNQLLKLSSAGSTRETISGNALDETSNRLDESEDESEEDSDENSEDSPEPIDAVVAFFITGEPFTQFKTSLRNLIYPPTTLQEALNTRHLRTVRNILKQQFDLVAKDNYVWLYELHEAGYSWREMAELLLEEADYAPWIPFEPSRLGHADISLGTHLQHCVHRFSTSDTEIPLQNLDMSTADVLIKSEEAKRTVQELCGLAGISPMSLNPKDWNGHVEFDQENTHANVCYTTHIDKESDFKVIVSRIIKALEGFYEAFGHIQQAGLCCDSLTILVNLTPTPLTSESGLNLEPSKPPQVEVHRVGLEPPIQLLEVLKNLSILAPSTQVETSNDRDLARNIAQTILEPLLQNASPQSLDSSDNIEYTLHLCALAVQFLCLGLLSYSQAHIGAIHPFFLDTPQRCVLLRGISGKHIKIMARLNNLTCFGDMLKGRPVLTFSSIIQPIPDVLLSQDTSKYDLLASPEDILDTWGPGQFVYRKDREEQLCAISVGGGVVHATDDTAKTFHWSLRDSIDSREWQMTINGKDNSRIESGTAPFTALFERHLKIVVGALVTVNETCSLDEDKCWSNCYHAMQPLGTHGPYWKAIERQGGLQAGFQYVFAQWNQTWAKDEGKTLKQMFLEHNDTYLISFLEYRWGVQVSFCTGVAKRVLLRQLVADLIPLFARRAIAIAFLDKNEWEDLVAKDIVNKFQNRKLADWYPSLTTNHRKVVSELVGCIIRTLGETGIDRDGKLVIAWPREHDIYQGFKVPCEKQSYWARILADSKDSATFAYVSTKCLVSSQAHCSGPTSVWKNVSIMLGTAVLPPMSVPKPTEWVMHHGEKYFIRTKDSLVHLSVHMTSGNGSTSAYACLITKPINAPEHIKNRLLNRKWQKEEGRLREGRDDIQHSVDVLVLHPEGFSATEKIRLVK